MQSSWAVIGPLQWIRYVNKQVKVKAGKDEELRGWLLTVDPVSASLVLVDFGDVGGASVRVVMGHAVQRVEVLRDADEETARRLQAVFAPPRTSGADADPEWRRRRRLSVLRWLEKNRVPVHEDGERLTVAGVLTLDAPYGPEDCSSSNQIILDRVQRLLRSDPHQHSPPRDMDQD